MTPIVFLAFADPRESALPQLGAELDAIKDSLRPLDSREYIKLVAEGRTSTDKLSNMLQDYQGKLSIFHYSGHADGDQLELPEGAAFREGLASLLSQEKELKLVFLNGCATKGHVEILLEMGVPAVIATQTSIKDNTARDFATAFYRAMANKRSIKQAFQFAKGDIELRHQEVPEMQVRAKVVFGKQHNGMPWGLYTREENDPVLNWSLPYYRERGLDDFLKQDMRKSVKTNKAIVKVLDRMCQIDKDIAANSLTIIKDGKPTPADPSSYLDSVIVNFPWVVGSQIHLLRQKVNPDMDRLKQLLSTYVLTSQLLYYILLSDGWEQKQSGKWSLPKSFKGFRFPGSAEELERQDFTKLLTDLFQQIRQWQGAGQVELFVPELITFCELLLKEDHPLHKAWKRLEELRQLVRENKVEHLDKLCQEAEIHLTIFLIEGAFLAGYQLLTVRSINLDNPRTRPLEYEFSLGRLNALHHASLRLYEGAENRRKGSYANSKSIVLAPNENDLQFSLDLSPFIIDQNTFRGEELPHIFLLGFLQDDRSYYVNVNHDLYTALANEKGFDLFHTGMTANDFAKGLNDLSTDIDPLAGYFDEPEEEEKEYIFGLLEDQYRHFTSDFTPNPTR